MNDDKDILDMKAEFEETLHKSADDMQKKINAYIDQMIKKILHGESDVDFSKDDNKIMLSISFRTDDVEWEYLHVSLYDNIKNQIAYYKNDENFIYKMKELSVHFEQLSDLCKSAITATAHTTDKPSGG